MYFLNQLQYFLMRPWRYLFMRPSKKAHFWWKILNVPLLIPLSTILYVLTTPLRFFNALVYNMIIYNFATLYDRVLEIFVPRRGKIRHMEGTAYLSIWLIQFPWRVIKHGLTIVLAIAESSVMTVYETIFPTITLYHGTSAKAGVQITQKGKWYVGDGNFAGSGLYFAINKRAAEHYSRWLNDPILIRARVTLGYAFPLACAPKYIRKALYGRDGDMITKWGKKNNIRSVEWWRSDTQWWEYALLAPRGEFVQTWRIRILYVESFWEEKIRRIWGGKTLWMHSLLHEKSK